MRGDVERDAMALADLDLSRRDCAQTLIASLERVEPVGVENHIVGSANLGFGINDAVKDALFNVAGFEIFDHFLGEIAKVGVVDPSSQDGIPFVRRHHGVRSMVLCKLDAVSDTEHLRSQLARPWASIVSLDAARGALHWEVAAWQLST